MLYWQWTPGFGVLFSISGEWALILFISLLLCFDHLSVDLHHRQTWKHNFDAENLFSVGFCGPLWVVNSELYMNASSVGLQVQSLEHKSCSVVLFQCILNRVNTFRASLISWMWDVQGCEYYRTSWLFQCNCIVGIFSCDDNNSSGGFENWSITSHGCRSDNCFHINSHHVPQFLWLRLWYLYEPPICSLRLCKHFASLPLMSSCFPCWVCRLEHDGVHSYGGYPTTALDGMGRDHAPSFAVQTLVYCSRDSFLYASGNLWLPPILGCSGCPCTVACLHCSNHCVLVEVY